MPNNWKTKIRKWAQQFGLSFHRWELLEEALTHSSYRGIDPKAVDNERLEFIGDAVLDLVVGEWLYHKFPHLPPRDLTNYRSALVDREQLAAFAEVLQLEPYVRRGWANFSKGTPEYTRMLADAFEALIGAIYLDQGLKRVQQFVYPLLQQAREKYKNNNYKGILQEWSQKRGLGLPQYKSEQVGGTPDRPRFRAKVFIQGKLYGQGEGGSKREAEKKAARDALEKIGHPAVLDEGMDQLSS